jgi:kinesin family protein 6/9
VRKGTQRTCRVTVKQSVVVFASCRVHVPYRNSLMTLVLRDSLGGNCQTVMVATVSGEAAQMEESISTCRFAQRVALVTNEVSAAPGC